MLKPTILAMGMATVMASAAISPALGLIAKAFPEASPTMIKLILTAPSIMIIPFSFFSSYLTSKITKKSIVMIGLTIYLIGGVGAQFSSNIETLLILRLVLGAGVGLIMPLSMSLINDYFEGKERTKMMGYNSAFSNLGGILTMLLAGWLATFGWSVPFNVYFLGLIIFVLVFFFLPKGKIQMAESTKKKKSRLPLAVFGYAAAMGGIMLIYYSIPTNIALYLEQNNLGGAALAGTIVSFATVGGMITSFLLVQIQSLFKKFVIPAMLLSMGIAFILLTFTQSVPVVILSVCLVGFGQGTLFPIIVLKTLDSIPNHQSDQALALTTTFTFSGQFISPIVLDSMGRIFHQSNIRFQYGMLAVIIVMIVVINTAMIIKSLKKAPSTSS